MLILQLAVIAATICVQSIIECTAIFPHGLDNILQLTDPDDGFLKTTLGGRDVFISVNGAITFDQALPHYIARSTTNPYDTRDKVVFVYWADLSIENSKGEIRYTTVTSSGELNLFNTEIRQKDPNFTADEALRVTWKDVPVSTDVPDTQVSQNLRNTFQVVIACQKSTGKHYAILNYDNLEVYPEGYAATATANAGYSWSKDPDSFCELPGSHSTDVLKLTCRSNTGTDGRWLIGLDPAAQALAPCPATYTRSTGRGDCAGDSGTGITHGNWGSWGLFTTCTKSCVGGTRTQTRFCNNPSPSGGGNSCAGSNSNAESCNSNIACQGTTICDSSIKNRRYKVDGTDCRTNKQCHNGVGTEQTCAAAGQYFDEARQGCFAYSGSDRPVGCNNPDCSAGITFLTAIDVLPQCTNIYQCDNQMKYKLPCPNSYHFDQVARVCTDEAPTGCRDPFCNGKTGLHSTHGSSCDAKYVVNCQSNGVRGDLPNSCRVDYGNAHLLKIHAATTDPALKTKLNRIPFNVDGADGFKIKYFDRSTRQCVDAAPATCQGCNKSPCKNGATCTTPDSSRPNVYTCVCTHINTAQYGYQTDNNCNFISSTSTVDGCSGAGDDQCRNGGQCREFNIPNVVGAVLTCLCPFDQNANNWYGLRCERRDGVWGQWSSAWTSCTKRCGGGETTRTRSCVDQANEGLDCVGNKVQSKPCNQQPCPVNGGWTPFGTYFDSQDNPVTGWGVGTFKTGAYGACSKSCGPGTKRRSRACTQPVPQFGGANCVGVNYEDADCNLKSCENWAQWQDWTTCVPQCINGVPNQGTHTRKRVCMSGTVVVADSLCPGNEPSTQSKSCSKACIKEKSADIAFIFDESNSMKENEMRVQNNFAANIANGLQVYDAGVAQINYAFMDFSTRADVNFTFDNWKSQMTVKANGEYDITKWFTNNERRDHDLPAHSGPYGATGIINVLTEAKALFTNPTNPSRKKIAILITDGKENVYDYKNAGTTLAQLHQLQEDAATALKALNVDLWVIGIGTQIDETILRSISKGHTTHKEHFEKINSFSNEADFNEVADRLDTDITKTICPQPKSGVLEWSKWGACDTNCGNGQETLDYNCTKEEQGGCPCTPPSPRTRVCNIPTVETWYGLWTPWNSCTVNCGGGTQKRSRTCNRDTVCPDSNMCLLDSDTKGDRACNTHCCKVDAVVGGWVDWADCSKTCGGGTQRRTRTCTPAVCGGQACPATFEDRDCNTLSCATGSFALHKHPQIIHHHCEHMGPVHTQMFDHNSTQTPDALIVQLNSADYKRPTQTVVTGFTNNTFSFMTMGNSTYWASHFVIRDLFKNMNDYKDSFQYGKHVTQMFQSREHCDSIKFTRTMRDVPAIKVTVQVPCFDHFQNVWLKSVSKTGFELCYREGISWSSPSGDHKATFHWVAVAGDDTLIFDTITHTESHRVSLNIGARDPKDKHLFCKQISFNRNFKEDPRVFVTAEAKSTGKRGATYVAWVQAVERRTAIVCARSSDDHMDGTRENDIILNVVVLGHRIELDAGSILMEPVAGHPHVGCANVKLSGDIFVHKNFTHNVVHPQLTVNWKHAPSSWTREPHPASAVWSEDVKTTGFRVCVMVAGEKLPYMPYVNWVAHQVMFHHAHQPNRVFVGVKELDPWYTGSRCTTVKPDWHPLRSDTRVLVSVEHKPNKYTDAMTAWSEVNNGSLRICARELRNFDGHHQGVKLHFIINYDPLSPFLSEKGSFEFKRATFVLSDAIPTVCQKIDFKGNYNKLDGMSVIVNSHKSSWGDCPNCGDGFSPNDFSSWIEYMNKTSVRICMKSLRCGVYRETAEVHYVVAPTLCGSGWQYLDGRCYTKSEDCQNYDDAKKYCSAKTAQLPIVKLEPSHVLLDQLSEHTDTWLGMRKNTQVTSIPSVWIWNDGSGNVGPYTRWADGKPDGKGNDEQCAATIGGVQQSGWDDLNCGRCNFVICQKESPLKEGDTFINNP